MYKPAIVVIASLFLLAGCFILIHEYRSGKADTNLRKRFISALILVPGALSAIYAGGVLFAVFNFIIAYLCTIEFLKLVQLWDNPAYKRVALLSLAILMMAAYLEPSAVPTGEDSLNHITLSIKQFHPFFAAIVPLIMLNLLVPIFSRSYQGMVMRELANIFAVLYFGWFLAHTILLRNLEHGLGLATFFVVVVAANDTFAYAAGRMFGKHKLIMEISPKKTWEGFVFGIIGSLVFALIFQFLLPGYTMIQTLGAGLLIGITAPFGDLIVSVVKRDMHQKDSSQLIPGHGGILDRTDSIIFSAPNFFYYVLIIQAL